MRRLIVVVFLVITTPLVMKAQSSYVNVPSPDQPDKGKIVYQVDFNYFPVGTYGVFQPQLIYGVTNRVEAAMGVESFNTNGQQVALVSGVKYSRGWIYAGEKVYFPVFNMDSMGNYAYVLGSIPSETISFSFGIYNQIGVNTVGDTTGVLLAFRSRAYKWKKNYGYILSDWSSGSTGTFAAGFEWHPDSRWAFTPNYQIGNTGIATGNHNFDLTIAYNFN